MTVKRAKIHYIYISLIFIFFAGIYFFLTPKETPNLLVNKDQGELDLSAHWSQGNIVALMRHVERCDRSENQCLDGKKGITVPGKEMAIDLREHFKTFLDLDNTAIYNSPVKRTVQTAKFIFGDASINKKWLRKGCKKNLLNDIFNYKKEGKNLILITHGTCIKALQNTEGDRLINMDIHNKKTYGSTIFIAINKHAMQANVLGYLYPGDWIKLNRK